MSKTDYILRSISKTSAKRWEHYAISRIYHRLDDLEVEFVCQQCVRKSNGKIYLTDFFLPQLGMYLEIDEGHHNTDQAKKDDAERRFDIAEASGLIEHRIPASGVSIDTLNAEIETFIEHVRKRKAEVVAGGHFRHWDYEGRFKAKPHLEAGSIEIGPNAAFWTHKDALNCFGYNKGHLQKSVWTMPDHIRDAIGLTGRCMVWFPKLYEQAGWSNSLSQDGKLVTEINKDPQHSYDEPWDKRIVMARSRDELNRTLYRFVGLFEVVSEFRSGNEHRFRRIATNVRTYSA